MQDSDKMLICFRYDDVDDVDGDDDGDMFQIWRPGNPDRLEQVGSQLGHLPRQSEELHRGQH